MSGIIGDINSKSGIVNHDTETYYTNSFQNGWLAWTFQTQISDEDGIRVQRYGKVYVIHIAVYKTNMTVGQPFSSTITTLSHNNIKVPRNNVMCGVLSAYYGTSQFDQVARIEFENNGNINVYGHEANGTTFHLMGNFYGVDQG